jgi:hypothetical protein
MLNWITGAEYSVFLATELGFPFHSITEDLMSQPKVNDSVRLLQDIPELSLGKGEVGVIRSTWFGPAVSYEVEFHQVGLPYEVRCLLTAEQLMVEHAAADA